MSEKTIRRDLERMRYVQKISKYKQVTTQMDTTTGSGTEALVKVDTEG